MVAWKPRPGSLCSFCSGRHWRFFLTSKATVGSLGAVGRFDAELRRGGTLEQSEQLEHEKR